MLLNALFQASLKVDCKGTNYLRNLQTDVVSKTPLNGYYDTTL